MVLTAQQAVVATRKVYEDCEASMLEQGERVTVARDAAATLALQHLPILDCVQNVRNYIACVSWLQARSAIRDSEAKSYMYNAQVALQALNAGVPVPTRKVVKNASGKK